MRSHRQTAWSAKTYHRPEHMHTDAISLTCARFKIAMYNQSMFNPRTHPGVGDDCSPPIRRQRGNMSGAQLAMSPVFCVVDVWAYVKRLMQEITVSQCSFSNHSQRQHLSVCILFQRSQLLTSGKLLTQTSTALDASRAWTYNML